MIWGARTEAFIMYNTRLGCHFYMLFILRDISSRGIRETSEEVSKRIAKKEEVKQ